MGLLRRYRLALVIALPAGLVLGALLGLGLSASSNEDTRTIQWLLYTVPLGAGVGVATATIAALGAVTAVALQARRRPDNQLQPALGLIALGAGAGVALVILGIGTIFTVVQDYWSQWEFWLIASVVVGMIAASASAAVTAATSRYQTARS
ncbi:hypothetical protein [Amnibacterium setariae]|nr:hypothetical protein [Amnibacterium setariae]